MFLDLKISNEAKSVNVQRLCHTYKYTLVHIRGMFIRASGQGLKSKWTLYLSSIYALYIEVWD